MVSPTVIEAQISAARPHSPQITCSTASAHPPQWEPWISSQTITSPHLAHDNLETSSPQPLQLTPTTSVVLGRAASEGSTARAPVLKGPGAKPGRQRRILTSPTMNDR